MSGEDSGLEGNDPTGDLIIEGAEGSSIFQRIDDY